MKRVNEWYTKHYTSVFENRDQAQGASRVYKSRDRFWEWWVLLTILLCAFFLGTAFITGAAYEMDLVQTGTWVVLLIILPVPRLLHVVKVLDTCERWLHEHPELKQAAEPAEDEPHRMQASYR